MKGTATRKNHALKEAARRLRVERHLNRRLRASLRITLREKAVAQFCLKILLRVTHQISLAKSGHSAAIACKFSGVLWLGRVEI